MRARENQTVHLTLELGFFWEGENEIMAFSRMMLCVHFKNDLFLLGAVSFMMPFGHKTHISARTHTHEQIHNAHFLT